MLRSIAILLVIAALGMRAPTPQATRGSDWPTLAQALSKLETDTLGVPAELLERTITSFATARDGGVTAIAYYLDRDNSLDPPLYFAVRERGQRWRQVELRDPGHPELAFGSALDIHVSPTELLIDTHINPSAGKLLVVSRSTLALDATLDGWFQTTLPFGLIVFTHNMVHFAPAHPEELHTYDPRTKRAARLYPANERSPLRREFASRLRPIFADAEKQDPTNPYGWDADVFDVSVNPQSLEYAPTADELRFKVIFGSDRLPAASLLRVTYSVVCRPMTLSTRTCVESR